MKWQQFANWIFYGVLGYLAFSIDSNIKEMSKSVQALNTQMAVQISDSNTKNSILMDHETRLRIIERGK